MRRTARGSHAPADDENSDGPFVSFTDLFIGILFLFLILVTALMLMHQEAVRQAKREADAYGDMAPQAIKQAFSDNLKMKSELDAIHQRDAEHPPFRLAIAYNEFYSDDDGASQIAGVFGVKSERQWRFLRSVRIFKADNGTCVLDSIVDYSDTSWASEVDQRSIPTKGNPISFREVSKCLLTSEGINEISRIQDVEMHRTSPDLYEGKEIIHAKGGDVTHSIQYRILGVYDDSYKYVGDGGPMP